MDGTENRISGDEGASKKLLQTGGGDAVLSTLQACWPEGQDEGLTVLGFEVSFWQSAVHSCLEVQHGLSARRFVDAIKWRASAQLRLALLWRVCLSLLSCSPVSGN